MQFQSLFLRFLSLTLTIPLDSELGIQACLHHLSVEVLAVVGPEHMLSLGMGLQYS